MSYLSSSAPEFYVILESSVYLVIFSWQSDFEQLELTIGFGDVVSAKFDLVYQNKGYIESPAKFYSYSSFTGDFSSWFKQYSLYNWLIEG